MPNIADILDATHEVWDKNHAQWAAEERRLHGGYPMLVELEQFTNETEASYTSRKQQSPLLNFGRIHGTILIGHLNEVAPLPNYGTLGEVRERKAIPRGQETAAERFHYNANGVGTNGLQFTALASGIQLRTLATGFRWTMVEMPRRPDGKPEDAPITQEDIKNGHRPFIAEYRPGSVPMFEIEDGRTNWAVIRNRWKPDGEWVRPTGQKGYYLLVREGYVGLGDEYAGGGWWLFDPEKTLKRNGSWSRTRGEIPLCMFMADESEGTDDHPSVSTMPLMELNQLASGLMNRISERNWNARNAAKSQKHILGAEPTGFNLMIEHALAGSYYIPVQGSATPDGKWLVPQIYDGANGAVESSVYAEIIRSTIEEAHEIMVRQVTSTPDSTGRSKEAGFNEATSPLLSALATRRETWENTVIPWVEMRAGAEQPQGFVMWPTEFDLTPIAQKITSWYQTAILIGARAPSVDAIGAEKLAQKLGLWPSKEADATVAREQLLRSLSGVRPEQSDSMQKLTSSGGSLEGAAKLVGVGDESIALLVGGAVEGSPDGELPEAGLVSGAERGEDGTAVTAVTAAVPNAPPAAPQPDTSAILSEIAALRSDIAALPAAFVEALKSMLPVPAPAPAPPPAPLLLPPINITLPAPTQAGKTVSVTTPDNRTFTVESRPVESNGSPPPAPNA